MPSEHKEWKCLGSCPHFKHKSDLGPKLRGWAESKRFCTQAPLVIRMQALRSSPSGKTQMSLHWVLEPQQALSPCSAYLWQRGEQRVGVHSSSILPAITLQRRQDILKAFSLFFPAAVDEFAHERRIKQEPTPDRTHMLP